MAPCSRSLRFAARLSPLPLRRGLQRHRHCRAPTVHRPLDGGDAGHVGDLADGVGGHEAAAGVRGFVAAEAADGLQTVGPRGDRIVDFQGENEIFARIYIKGLGLEVRVDSNPQP